jgi:hypothetical protein
MVVLGTVDFGTVVVLGRVVDVVEVEVVVV